MHPTAAGIETTPPPRRDDDLMDVVMRFPVEWSGKAPGTIDPAVPLRWLADVLDRVADRSHGRQDRARPCARRAEMLARFVTSNAHLLRAIDFLAAERPASPAASLRVRLAAVLDRLHALDVRTCAAVERLSRAEPASGEVPRVGPRVGVVTGATAVPSLAIGGVDAARPWDFLLGSLRRSTDPDVLDVLADDADSCQEARELSQLVREIAESGDDAAPVREPMNHAAAAAILDARFRKRKAMNADNLRMRLGTMNAADPLWTLRRGGRFNRGGWLDGLEVKRLAATAKGQNAATRRECEAVRAAASR